MTTHPCEGMTPAEIAAFEEIAVNRYPDDGWKSIDALLKRGLIERFNDAPRRDAMGVYTPARFFVPLPILYQWCTWCSEQVENELRPQRPDTG